MGKGEKRQKGEKSSKGQMAYFVQRSAKPKEPLQLRHKKTAMLSRRFSVIWFGVVFCFDPKNGTPNKGKHHGVQCAPTFCI